MLPRSSKSRLATVVLLMLIGSSVGAQDTKWIVRGGGIYAATASDKSVSTVTLPPPMTQEATTLSVSDGPGFGVGLEYRLTERIGLEIAYLSAAHDADVVLTNDLGTFTSTDSLGLRTFTVGANYYFPANGRFLWSVGGFLAETFSDDVTFTYPALGRTDILAFDQDYGLGLKAAMDLPFAPGSPWMFSVEGRYMSTILESEVGNRDLDLNPLVLSLSVAYRF